MRFTQEDTFKFVQLYVDNECLWNKALPSYKNKHLRHKAIDSIIREMNLPGFDAVEVKNKIKNLRSTYNQEVIKIKRSAESGASSEDLYVPHMKWFHLLDMVIKQIKDYGVDMLSNWESGEQVCEDENQENDGFCHKQSESTPNQNLSIVQFSKQQSSKRVPRKPRGSKRKLTESSFAVRELKSAGDSSMQSEPDMNENEVFGKYVAKGLNALPPLESVLAQQEIQNILTKYRISALQSQSSSAYDTEQDHDSIAQTIILQSGQ